MKDTLHKLGEAATQIKNPYSLAALALLLTIYPVSFAAGIPDTAKPWLIAGMLLTAIVMVLILSHRATYIYAENLNWVDSVRRLIDSSNIPMYVTDATLTVLHCNVQLASIVDSDPSALIGRHLVELVRRFGIRVPQDKRERFEARQQGLISKALSDFAPHTEDTEFIDNSDLPGNSYQGLFKVWVHADKIRDVDGKVIGVFVIYHPVRIQPGDESIQKNRSG